MMIIVLQVYYSWLIYYVSELQLFIVDLHTTDNMVRYKTHAGSPPGHALGNTGSIKSCNIRMMSNV